MKYFFEVFRDPKDIHRVIIAGFISLFVSHAVYLYESTAQNVSIVHTNDYLLVSLVWFFVAYLTLHSIFSSKKNIMLYLRLFIAMFFISLGHRLYFGLESAGSWFFNTSYVIFSIPFFYYSLMGKFPQFVMDSFKEKPDAANVIQYQRASND
jgi:hypothetical protein